MSITALYHGRIFLGILHLLGFIIAWCFLQRLFLVLLLFMVKGFLSDIYLTPILSKDIDTSGTSLPLDERGRDLHIFMILATNILIIV